MTDAAQLTPAKPDDIAEAIAHALQFDGRKRTHRSDEIMARIVAEHLVEALEGAGGAIMQRPPIAGGAAIGFEARDPKATRSTRPPLERLRASGVLCRRRLNS